MSKFKVGDKVRVVNCGQTYSLYDSFFKENKVNKSISKKYIRGEVEPNGTIGSIVFVGKHISLKIDIYVVDTKDKVVLISENGMELVDNTTEPITITRHNRSVVVTDGITYGSARCSKDDEFDLEIGAKMALYRFFENQKKKTEKTTEVREVKRQAKVGEWIKIVDPFWSLDRYKEGDVLKVNKSFNKDTTHLSRVFVDGMGDTCILQMEYVVLENYKPTEEKENETQYYNGKVICVDDGGLQELYTVGKVYQFKGGGLISDEGNKIPIKERIHNFKDWQEWTSGEFVELKESEDM